MKNKRFSVLGGLVCMTLLLFFVGCGEKEQCATYTFYNNSRQSLSIHTYKPQYHTNTDESFDNLKPNEFVKLIGPYCTNEGVPGRSFVGVDSVFLFFDDTLKVVLYSDEVSYGASVYGDSIFLADDGWVKVESNKKGTLHHFEYEFTDWHYQKALEANGYKVD